jgi:predicted permease
LRDLHSVLAATPSVQSSSLSWGAFPMFDDDELLFWREGDPRPASKNEMNWALKYIVEPGYFDVMKIPLRRGRFFNAADNEHSAPVAVIDEEFARKFFGQQDPLGKRLYFDPGIGNSANTAEIVGVVGHVNQFSLASADVLRTQIYLPFIQLPDDEMALVPAGTAVAVRYAGSSTAAFGAIRAAVQRMNSEQVVYDAETMNEIVATSLASQRFCMILLGGFAILALVLASIGIYGVISYLVAQRTNEFGIRMALGAQRADVLKMVIVQGAKMALRGIALGAIAAFGLTRLMSNLLFGVSSSDPLTYSAVAALLISVALAACYIPARRATRVDPVVALRYE